MIRHQCLNCGEQLECDDSMAGLQQKCHKCGHLQTVLKPTPPTQATNNIDELRQRCENFADIIGTLFACGLYYIGLIVLIWGVIGLFTAEYSPEIAHFRYLAFWGLVAATSGRALRWLCDIAVSGKHREKLLLDIIHHLENGDKESE